MMKPKKGKLCKPLTKADINELKEHRKTIKALHTDLVEQVEMFHQLQRDYLEKAKRCTHTYENGKTAFKKHACSQCGGYRVCSICGLDERAIRVLSMQNTLDKAFQGGYGHHHN